MDQFPSAPSKNSREEGDLFKEQADEAEALYKKQVDQILKEHQKHLEALDKSRVPTQFQLKDALDPLVVASKEVYILRCLLNQSLRSAMAGARNQQSGATLFLSHLLGEIALKRGTWSPLTCVRNELMQEQGKTKGTW